MASQTTLTAKNLETLGSARLADLLIKISTGSAVAKRRLRTLAGSAAEVLIIGPTGAGIVPFSAGGPTDTVRRLIAEKMSAAQAAPWVQPRSPGPRQMVTAYCCTISAWPHRPHCTASCPMIRALRFPMSVW